ncbi:MAG TPA: alpha/beta hydrolase, partial [Nocardioides sp.]
MVTVHGISFPDPRPETIVEVEGDPVQVDAFAETLYGIASDYEELADFAWTASRPGARPWIGDDADAYATSAESVQTDANTLQTGMRRVARAVTIHAQVLEELRTLRDQLVERRAAANSWRTSLIGELRAMEEPLHPITRSGYENAAQTLRDDYSELVSDHAKLKRELRANDRTMNKAFTTNLTLADIAAANEASAALAGNALLKNGGPMGPLFRSPEAAREWWEGLSAEERHALLVESPEVIGRMDGLPADVRDEANRILLDEQIAGLTEKQEDGTISPHEASVLDNAQHVDDAVRQAEKYVDPLTGEHPPIQLWMYDPEKYGTDSGSVAISIGDLDTADNLAVRVPGITSDIDGISAMTRDATNVYEAARFNGNGENSVASMIWLNYNAPGGVTDPATLTEHRAEDGGATLANDIDGLRASRADNPAHLTLIGHSYGSTTAGHAAGDHEIDIDDLVLVGSPGGGYSDVSAYGMDGDNVWAG